MLTTCRQRDLLSEQSTKPIMRLTTKKKTGMRGLAAICSGHPGFEIKLDGVVIGGISQHKADKRNGWYYFISATGKIPWSNTASREISTWQEAKAEAFAVIRKYVKSKQ
jgi:hypothetical protein